MATSNEQKLYDSFVAHYPDAMQSLTDLSVNSSGNRPFISCDYQGFNFDAVTNVCTAENTKEKSPDGLFLCDDCLYLIEFKESSFKKVSI